jgi:hypothetical protein
VGRYVTGEETHWSGPTGEYDGFEVRY